ncbi:unnamed protein product [Thlaspi arvense]|uniref:Transposase MuDR plant domain-containing protein n=1 Tax=Thlaspi arvense TaxID=13288 RepID=A0AAU9RBS4_THLAR|nr:unnamed protein product [Thlaspi arvense]
MLVVEAVGYEYNMKKVSWFPPDDESLQRVDIDDSEVLGKAVSYALGSGALTLFIVREDDPYLMNCSGDGVGVSPFEDYGDNANGDSDNSDGSSDESSESSESSYDERSANDGGSDIVVQNEDASEAEREVQEDANSDSDGARKTIDESKYKVFALGQCYSTIWSFKNAITKYAVKKNYDISYFKTDSKRVVAVCCKRACPWRICGSINSTNSRVVVRALQEEHDCTWQGESLNAAIRVARTKPVVKMLEEMRRRVLVSNEKKRKESEKAKGIYTPRARAFLDQQIKLAKNCSPLPCGLGKVKPPPYKNPQGRPPGKKIKRENGEAREKGKMTKVGLVMPTERLRREQPERPTSISQALPKRRPGRPRRDWFGAASSSQEASRQHQPSYDTAPIQIPREEYGLFTSRLIGDDYISVGSRVTDTSDNTILPSYLFAARECKKMASRGRGKKM